MFLYIKKVVLVAVIFLGLVAGFNALMDPYWINGFVRVEGLNFPKHVLNVRTELMKWGRLARGESEVVILGSSRSLVGMDAGHAAFGGQKAVNLAFSSQSLKESWYLLKYVSQRKPPTLVLMGLDFEASLKCWRSFTAYPRKYDGDWLPLQLLFSRSTLVDSIRTLMRVGAVEGEEWTPTGGLMRGSDYVVARGGAHAMFTSNETSYANVFRRRRHGCAVEGEDVLVQESFSEIRDILALAYQANIDLRLFVHPIHARQWELFAAMGMDSHLEQWRRLLVQAVEEEARKAGRPPFPLWDFGGHDAVTTENVPLPGSGRMVMDYYFDSSHYMPRVGDMIVRQIMNYGGARQQGPEVFGVMLSPEQLDARLQKIRRDRDEWRRRHPGPVQQIHGLVAKAEDQSARPESLPGYD